MDTFTMFILTLFFHGYKNRYWTLYHLLAGKRTASVEMYGFLFGNLRFLGTLPYVKKEDYEAIIYFLEKEKFINKTDEHRVQITEKGKQAVSTFAEKINQLKDIDGFLFSDSETVFLQKLFFSSQVLSFLLHKENAYIPIETNRIKQLEIKKWLQKQVKEQKDVGQEFYFEWLHLLDSLPDREKLLWVQQLSGSSQIGLAESQIIENPNDIVYLLQKKNTLHLWLKKIRNSPELFPMMRDLFVNQLNPEKFQSAKRSRIFFEQGYSIEEIVRLRKLKIGTVADHFIEQAILDPNFSFSRLLNEKQMNSLQLLAEKSFFQEWSYKEVEETCDFLTFRLFQILKVREQKNG